MQIPNFAPCPSPIFSGILIPSVYTGVTIKHSVGRPFALGWLKSRDVATGEPGSVPPQFTVFPQFLKALTWLCYVTSAHSSKNARGAVSILVFHSYSGANRIISQLLLLSISEGAVPCYMTCKIISSINIFDICNFEVWFDGPYNTV